ncbi:hypothetical protein KC345_g477 [Hortaea werneckii]|nr:hypothetical protein KC345_g477 [Hortaea werneckii]
MLHHFNHIQFSSQPTPPTLYPPNTGPTLRTSSQPNPKLRAACDECRLKKLKCTGEQPACSRCVREGIQCIYSPQKQMGRPKKRQRVEAAEDDGEVFHPRQQEEHLAPLQPTSKPSQMGEKDSDLPPFTLDFSQATQNTAAADATWTSDWTSWEDFERFLGNGDDHLPSWLSSNNWSAEIPGQDALPGLTPDFATNFPSEGISPPILNVPPELLLPRQAEMGKDASKGGAGWGVGEGDASRENDFLSDGQSISAPGGKGGWGDDSNLVPTPLPPITTTTAFPLIPPPPNPNLQDHDHDHQQQPSLLPPPSCACLSTLYLTLSTLQQQQPQSPSSSSSPSFPHTLVPLRKAMQTATSILTCPICPQRFLSAMQNTQLLGTLLVCLAERFRGVVEGIEGEGKGEEWRRWSKGVVWGEIYGRGSGSRRGSGSGKEVGRRRGRVLEGVEDDEDGETEKEEEEGEGVVDLSLRSSSASTPSFSSLFATTTIENPPPIHFLALTKAMYDRQLAWHSSTKEVVGEGGDVKTIPSLPEDFPRDREGRPIGGPSLRREDHMCLKFRGFAEKLVDGLNWS